MTRLAAGVAGGMILGWWLGYRQGYFDGVEGVHLRSTKTVGLGDWR